MSEPGPVILSGLELDAILPSQWGVLQRPKPELALLAAILESAMVDAARKERGRLIEQARERALSWIWSEARGVMSFWWVCENLGVDPGRVRQAGPLRRAGLRKRGPMERTERAHSI